MTLHFRALASEPSFPKRLFDIARAQHVSMIEAEGALATSLDDLGPSVAIVGTRNAPRDASEYTRSLSAELARAGCRIISGGAVGIDTAAHLGALDAGGSTLVVVATGIDVAYPVENEELFLRARREGAVVAIQERGRGAQDFLLLRRNAVIAALADVVVVIAAPRRSGSLSTAHRAQELARPLFVAPGPPWDPFYEGSLRLIGGGTAQVLTSSAQILKAANVIQARPLMPPGPNPLKKARRRLRALPEVPSSNPPLPLFQTEGSRLPSPSERQTLLALQRGPVSIDQLVAETGLDVGSIRGLLLTWTVEGVVREGPRGLYRLISH